MGQTPVALLVDCFAILRLQLMAQVVENVAGLRK